MILIDPLPRTLSLICDDDTTARLRKLGELVVHESNRMPDAMVDEYLPQASILIGQTDLPAERLERAGKLRAVFNVEGNFRPNVDYACCAARGIEVLSVGPAFAQPVAEAALGMAIDLARGITRADRDFRAGREGYELAGNSESFLFSGSTVGLIGFGDLGRAFRPLLAPFRCPVKVYDPWLSDRTIRAHDAEPASLDEVLSSCRVIVVMATVTSDNAGFLGRREFDLIRPGSVFLLMSRAAIVDFPAFLDAVGAGRFRAATDVFPVEPVAADDPVRGIDGLLLSAHRTGGLREAFYEIGRMVVSDAELVLRGLPPQSCKRAHPALAGRQRSMPVEQR
ncbi:MAG: hydroxyacid dehydrogenase [Inquilinus sp.]|nr:hydroxyacid dehydrogenase [Inquilinus sp.]